MPLSRETIAKLYEAAPARNNQSTGAKWMDAQGEWHYGKPKADIVGRFEGKAGSLHRSRKGRMVRAANGRRQYVADWEGIALAYKV